MAIATMGDLRAEVAAECMRTNHRGFSESWNRMLSFAENRIYDGGGRPFPTPPVRVTEMEFTADPLTFTAGAAAVPTDFLELRSFIYTNDLSSQLKYEPPGTFRLNRSTQATGYPNKYTIEGDQVLISPLITGDLVFNYYARPANMTSDDDSNAVLARYPNLYFQACLIEAYGYTRDDARRQVAMGDFTSVVNGLMEADIRKKTGGTNLYPRIRNSTVRC